MKETHPRGPLRETESVILVDRKERKYLRRLALRKTFSIRGGKIASEAIIGLDEGCSVHSSLNERFLVLRPTLEQLIPLLPRKAQVVYPKDIGLMVVLGNIFPGAKIIEAGVGPGALTLSLLRAVGKDGQIISYEIREDFARMAKENIAEFYGAAEQWTLKVADVMLHLEETDADQIILDLPEPWRVVDKAWASLRPGGVLLSFLPTVLQVKSLVDSLRNHGGFGCIETMESLIRPWHIQGMSVRPEHRMVAHTGFLTVGRRVQISGRSMPQERDP
jgi:tRNA (adenine57-N1/adenine58-N1)-methyltransferase